MALKRKDRIFPGESILVSRSEYESVYRLEFEDGFGTMTSRTVMPGVTLIFNDFHTNHEFPGESRCPGMIEINHCRTGRYECTMRDGRIVWLGPQDFAVSDMGRPPVRCCFGQKIYQGISLVVEPGRRNVLCFKCWERERRGSQNCSSVCCHRNPFSCFGRIRGFSIFFPRCMRFWRMERWLITA